MGRPHERVLVSPREFVHRSSGERAFRKERIYCSSKVGSTSRAGAEGTSKPEYCVPACPLDTHNDHQFITDSMNLLTRSVVKWIKLILDISPPRETREMVIGSPVAADSGAKGTQVIYNPYIILFFRCLRVPQSLWPGRGRQNWICVAVLPSTKY